MLDDLLLKGALGVIASSAAKIQDIQYRKIHHI